jgi:hypothetical protein
MRKKGSERRPSRIEFAAPPEPGVILFEMPEIAKSPCKFTEI